MVRFIVKNDVKEIRRLIQANRGEHAELHQGSAISVDDDYWLPGESVCHTETNRRRSAHSANDVEVVSAIRDCEELAAGLACCCNDRFVTGESFENEFDCGRPRGSLIPVCQEVLSQIGFDRLGLEATRQSVRCDR